MKRLAIVCAWGLLAAGMWLVCSVWAAALEGLCAGDESPLTIKDAMRTETSSQPLIRVRDSAAMTLEDRYTYSGDDTPYTIEDVRTACEQALILSDAADNVTMRLRPQLDNTTRLEIEVDGRLMPDATQPNQPLLIAKAPPEATVPMILPQAVGAFYIERVQIVMDLIKDGEVATAANYAASKLDYLSLPESNKYARALCVYYKRCTAEEWDGDPGADPPIPAMSADDRAKLYMDFLRYMHVHAYKQVYGDDAVDSFRETKYDELETEARASLGEDEYVAPVEPE